MIGEAARAITAAIVVHIGGLQIDHDVRNAMVLADCNPNATCQTYPSLDQLPLGGQFTNTHFSCWGNSILVPAVLQFEAQSQNTFSVSFVNQTGNMLGGGTSLPFSFTCEGT